MRSIFISPKHDKIHEVNKLTLDKKRKFWYTINVILVHINECGLNPKGGANNGKNKR